MENPLIKDLGRKARPDGYFNFGFLIRRKGERDYKNSQLCTGGDIYQTPWLLERVRCLAEYDNRMYCRVDRELEPWAHVIAAKCKEIELLEKTVRIPAGMDSENRERMMARMAEADRKRSEILIRLSEFRMDMETMDAALQHHLQRAENIIMKHAASYWSGVLKAAASSDMPPEPDMKLPDIPGRAVYEAHLSNIRKRLNRALADQEPFKEV